jgi:hypothetical protein
MIANVGVLRFRPTCLTSLRPHRLRRTPVTGVRAAMSGYQDRSLRGIRRGDTLAGGATGLTSTDGVTVGTRSHEAELVLGRWPRWRG